MRRRYEVQEKNWDGVREEEDGESSYFFIGGSLYLSTGFPSTEN